VELAEMLSRVCLLLQHFLQRNVVLNKSKTINLDLSHR
jgi:hypothetical protein